MNKWLNDYKYKQRLWLRKLMADKKERKLKEYMKERQNVRHDVYVLTFTDLFLFNR